MFTRLLLNLSGYHLDVYKVNAQFIRISLDVFKDNKVSNQFIRICLDVFKVNIVTTQFIKISLDVSKVKHM